MQILKASVLILISFYLTLLTGCDSKPVVSSDNNPTLSTSMVSTTIPTLSPTEIQIKDPYQWNLVGPWSDAQSLLFDPRLPNTMYVWTPNGMIISQDAGENWKAMQNLQNTLSVYYFETMIMDPLSPSTIYGFQGLMTDDDELKSAGELFKSFDGGLNWNDLGIEIEKDTFGINPENPAILYAGTISKGIFKSDDGGASWTSINNGLPKINEVDYIRISVLMIDTKLPNNIYAGTATGEMYESIDDGINWKSLNTGVDNASIKEILTDPFASTTIYALIEGQGIIKSINNGKDWKPINRGLTESEIISIAIDQSNSAILYAGMINSNIFKSPDGGENWNQAFIPETSEEVFCFQGIEEILIDPINPSIIYALSGGETGRYLIRSTDSGQNWNIILPDMYASLVESVAVAPDNPMILLAGTRSGLLKSINGGAKWSSTDLQDNISTLMFEPTNPNTLYATSTSDIYKSTNQGDNWKRLTPGEYSYTTTSITTNQNNEIIIYAMDFDNPIISKSTDGGLTWIHSKYTRANNIPFDNLLIDSVSLTTLYAGSFFEGVFKSIDSGKTWQLINSTLINLQTLDMDPINPAILYAGTENAGVFRSLDGGENWLPINKGLDPSSIQAFTIDQNTTTILYLATNEGIYKSMDRGDNWEPFNLHIPTNNTTVTSIFIDPETLNTIFAGTYFQGIYLVNQEK